MSLAHSRAVGDNLAVATLYKSTEVRLNLSATHCPILMNGIHLTIIVKENRQVVDVALHVDMFPWSLSLVGNEYLHAMSIDI